MQLSYGVKNTRPMYSQLQSEVYYISKYTLQTGNPLLKNEIRHSLDLSGRWKWLAFSANYMHIKDALENGEVVPAGMGEGKVKEILKSLKDRDYKGFLSLETHLTNFVGLASLEEGKEKQEISTNTEDKFKLAVKSLRDILKTL